MVERPVGTGTLAMPSSSPSGRGASDQTYVNGCGRSGPFDRIRCRVALLLRDQSAQIIPERLKRQMHPSLFGGQGGQRVKFHLATGLADRPRHAINDVVGPDPNIVRHRSFAHGAGQRYEEGHWGLRIRHLHARIVQCSISL